MTDVDCRRRRHPARGRAARDAAARASATRPCDRSTARPRASPQRAAHQPTARRVRPRPADRSARDVAGLRPADHGAAARDRVLADDRRRQRAVGDAGGRSSSGSRISAAALFDRLGVPVVDHRLHLARRLSRPGVGHQRHAAADGDLLPAVHDPRGPRLSAARRVQSRLPVPARRRARQAGADDGDGLRLQRRGHHRDAGHRLAARTAGRDPHQQLRAVQRPVPDADHARPRSSSARRFRRRSRRSPPPARSSASC